MPIIVDVFVDLYFHQVLTLTQAANFFPTTLSDEKVECESENETISNISSLNISTILVSITASPRSTAAASPRLSSEVSDSFSDSEVTIGDNNFTSTKRKVIRTRVGLRRAARRDPRTRGSRAHQVVGRQATADKLSSSDTVCAKKRLSFQGIPGVHVEPYDSSSPLPFLKTFITDELVENIVNFANKYEDIIINDPAIQPRVAIKHHSLFWKNTNKDEIWFFAKK